MGREKHEILRLVPQPLLDVFQIGSDAPGDCTASSSVCQSFGLRHYGHKTRLAPISKFLANPSNNPFNPIPQAGFAQSYLVLEMQLQFR